MVTYNMLCYYKQIISRTAYHVFERLSLVKESNQPLKTGVGRFGANMLRWGLSTSDCCECGAEQTAEHITSGRCPIYRPPEGIHGLNELDAMTRT